MGADVAVDLGRVMTPRVGISLRDDFSSGFLSAFSSGFAEPLEFVLSAIDKFPVDDRDLDSATFDDVVSAIVFGRPTPTGADGAIADDELEFLLLRGSSGASHRTDDDQDQHELNAAVHDCHPSSL